MNKSKYSVGKVSRRADLLMLFMCITGLMLAGMIGSLLGGSAVEYDTGIRPLFAVPSLFLTAMWNAAFTILGISLSGVYKFRPTTDKETKRKFISLILFASQLAFVTTWGLIFFRLNIPLLAFVWAAIIFILSVAYMISVLPYAKPAGWVIIPYLVFLSYIAYISIMFVL